MSDDGLIIEAFRNFLSWGERPATIPQVAATRNVPPAWFAYAIGLTSWCPPKGEM
jgi:hypothetical protein